MSFEAKIICDADGCTNSKILSSCNAGDAEIEIETIGETNGGWLIDYENDYYYCPNHAAECANELGLEYSSS